MSNNRRYRSIHPHLDRFQKIRLERMNYLLEEIEERGSVRLNEFLGFISHNYRIRRATGLEYIDDWEDAGYIVVEKDIIKFVKKPLEEANPQ